MIIEFYVMKGTLKFFHILQYHFKTNKNMSKFYDNFLNEEIPEILKNDMYLEMLNFYLKEFIIDLNKEVWDKYYVNTEITEEKLLEYSLNFTKYELEEATGIAYLTFLLFMMLPDNFNKKIVYLDYDNEVLSMEIEDKI